MARINNSLGVTLNEFPAFRYYFSVSRKPILVRNRAVSVRMGKKWHMMDMLSIITLKVIKLRLMDIFPAFRYPFPAFRKPILTRDMVFFW